MEFEQLRGFVETARQQSFTKAAENLFLSQPAVSLQIKALEEELGERLFDRRGRRVNLTDAGRVLLERATRILDLVDRTREDLASLKGVEIGSVRVAASDTNCAYILPPVVKAFREARPGVEIHLVDRMSPEVVRLVLAGDVDFGLATLPVIDPRVSATPAFVRQDVVVCGPGHPLASLASIGLQEICEYPQLLLAKGSTTRALMDRLLMEQGLVPQVAMEFGSIEVIKKFVAEGMGVAVVPDVAVRREVAAAELVSTPVNGLPGRHVGIVQRVGAPASRASEAFLDTLSAQLEMLGLAPLSR